ncbi:MAG: glycosyltransferase family 9 protein [Pirellulales bacterium]
MMSTTSSPTPSTVCVFLPNWIGDVAMATPTLRALRERFPRPSRLIGIMRPYVAKVLDGTSWLDEHVLYDRHSRKPELAPRAVIQQLSVQRPDVAVLLTNSLASAWIAWRVGARQRIGFARNLRGLLLTERRYMPRNGWRRRPWSAVDQYLTLAEAAGCTIRSRQLELATLPADEAGGERVWQQLGLEGRRVIAVNSGAATAAAKMWPTARVEELCRRLVLEPDTAVLLLCGPQERESVAALCQRIAHPRVTSMADQDLSLGVSKSVIRRSHLMVSTDSGPRHMAAAFGVPTVAIFGSIAPAWSINYHPAEIRLSRELPCGPCGRKQCPLGHARCIGDITADEVLGAIDRLERIRRQAA